MRIQDLLSEERAAVPPKPRNPVAKNAGAAIGGGAAGQHKNQKRAAKQGDVKHKRDLMPMEAGMYTKPGRPGAYGDDYRSSVSGMGKKDSLAYQQDGGANDEGEADAPYQAAQDKPVLKGYYFYNVKPGQEDDAGMYGVKKTKSGKWAKAKYSTSGRSFDLQKDGADKAFGQGNWWSLNKNEGVAEGLDHNKRQQLIQFLVKKLDWEANYLELATDAELIKWYKNVQAGKKPMGY